MGFFDNEGKCTYEWNLFLDNFPGIGVFKMMHDSNVAFVDKNVSSILKLGKTLLPRDEMFALIDKLTENRIDEFKNIYSYKCNDETIYINLRISYEDDCVIGFIQDVTGTMHLHSKEEVNRYDELTGIFTRDYFIRKVRTALTEISGMAKCCMAVVHINGIERVDNELNYDKTALCIKAAADAIKRFESEDILIGVKSYKDFFIFFRQRTKKEVTDILHKMSEAVRSCRIIDEFGNEIQTRSGSFTITSGYCWYPTQAATLDMMINYADFAVFSAISTGSVDVEFSPEKFVNEQNSYADSRLIAEIIEENDFEYFFQPIVHATDGEIYAYEALMRPKNLTPLELLRMAREHGKLYEIEFLTFDNILGQVAKHKDEFKGRKVFINSIPDFMLKERDFYRLCEKYGDDIMKQVVIELTEQADLSDEHIGKLRELYCQYGCMIAIDDYGSGYSNSAAVLNLTPDIIKIDRTLVMEINKNTRKQHFLTGIIDFAKLNNIKVLAEGVETYEELSVAIRRGVDYVQGYYTAKPAFTVTDHISEDIINGIRAININKPELQVINRYEIKESIYEPVDICAISEKGYNRISISCDYVHFKGNPVQAVNMIIEIEENASVFMVIENVMLNGVTKSVISINDGARVRLELKGNNTFLYDGISIPDSADLTIVGDGNLVINSSKNNGCCIGASYNDPFGRIVIDTTGNLVLHANGDHAVCIGGGMTSRKSAISITNGNVKLSSTGVDCLGIGCYNGSAQMFLGNSCVVNVSSSGENSVCIGSIYGSVDITASRCNIKTQAYGVRACGVGTLAALKTGKITTLNFNDVNADISIKAQYGAGIGYRTSECEINTFGCRFSVNMEGNCLAGIGSVEADGNVVIEKTTLDFSDRCGPESRRLAAGETGVKLHNCILDGEHITEESYIQN